jgi:Rieske Fe-S protein
MDETTCSGGCACQRVNDERGSVSRRGVLAGSAAAVAVMALGACASPDETSSSGSATSSGPASPTPKETESATPTSEESASPTSEASPAGEPLAGTGDFPVGGGVVVKTANGPVVVTHPTDTEFLAFNGRCPHAGCPVAEVLENTIMCNCHGSTFDGSTGDRLEGPAPTGLEPVPIQVAGGEIYLA